MGMLNLTIYITNITFHLLHHSVDSTLLCNADSLFLQCCVCSQYRLLRLHKHLQYSNCSVQLPPAHKISHHNWNNIYFLFIRSRQNTFPNRNIEQNNFKNHLRIKVTFGSMSKTLASLTFICSNKLSRPPSFLIIHRATSVTKITTCVVSTPALVLLTKKNISSISCILTQIS